MPANDEKRRVIAGRSWATQRVPVSAIVIATGLCGCGGARVDPPAPPSFGAGPTWTRPAASDPPWEARPAGDVPAAVTGRKVWEVEIEGRRQDLPYFNTTDLQEIVAKAILHHAAALIPCSGDSTSVRTVGTGVRSYVADGCGKRVVYTTCSNSSAAGISPCYLITSFFSPAPAPGDKR